MATRALVRCTDIIIESSINPIALARRLYSKEIMSEDTYKKVKDNKSRDSHEDRLELILDDLKDRVTHNASIFTHFINILNGFARHDLASAILTKYEGKLCI